MLAHSCSLRSCNSSHVVPGLYVSLCTSSAWVVSVSIFPSALLTAYSILQLSVTFENSRMKASSNLFSTERFLYFQESYLQAKIWSNVFREGYVNGASQVESVSFMLQLQLFQPLGRQINPCAASQFRLPAQVFFFNYDPAIIAYWVLVLKRGLLKHANQITRMHCR